VREEIVLPGIEPQTNREARCLVSKSAGLLRLQETKGGGVKTKKNLRENGLPEYFSLCIIVLRINGVP
jgi:hypothetical protein